MKSYDLRAWFKYDDPKIKFSLIIKPNETIYFTCGISEYSYIILCDDDWIIEEYVGINDRSGKRIYVGDILLGQGGLLEIQKREGGFIGITAKEKLDTFFPLFEPIADMQMVRWCKESIIVGNIHEGIMDEV